MLIDGARRPLGRVGISSQGPTKGKFILLYPELVDDAWTLVLEPPVKDFSLQGYLFGVDNLMDGTERINHLLERWGIQWLSGGGEPEVEERVFNFRCTLTVPDGPNPWWA
ncbi:hypothetical protein ACFSYH_12620 [Populibacterium corticicola]|uniref:Uncharacterized protein n=1 Tax=Populibacterium corticicola TaxID=1812826 RepID=A0ABW5XG01_9MICO